MRQFPWARAMEIGFGHLRLAPRDFWVMTLPELAAAATALSGHTEEMPMTRTQFHALISCYPD